MLTDRPDVPHTILGSLKKPKWSFWGQTQERAYSVKVILNPEVCVLSQIRISYIESENVFSFAVD